MTPAETQAIVDRHGEYMQEIESNSALIAASLYNVKRTKKTDRVWQRKDFMLRKVVKVPELPKDATEEQKLAWFKVNFAKRGNATLIQRLDTYQQMRKPK